MVLKRTCSLKDNPTPLELVEWPDPVPQGREVLVKVSACGVCHTELDEIEGRMPPPHLPVVLGHQAVGRIISAGPDVKNHEIDERVGIAWIYSACRQCSYCRRDQENLCEQFQATGRDAHGGYAQYMTISQEFVHPIPDVFSDSQAAPLLCAGAIGYRSLRLAKMKNSYNLGLTGFGASAHLVLKMVRFRYPDANVFVFARSEGERAFARDLGAVWAGDSGDRATEKLDCIIDTTPAWKPVVEALKNLKSGGRLVINAIRKEDYDKDYLLKLNYPDHLWLEKEIKSVANVARGDVREFLQIAAEIPILPEVQEFALEEANAALLELKQRKIRGAKVLRIDG